MGEPDLAEFGVGPDRVAVREVALEQPQRERVLEQALDRSLERPGAVGGVPAGLGDQLSRTLRQLEEFVETLTLPAGRVFQNV